MNDSTRKYLLYATGETVLIVLGILIALAINARYTAINNNKIEHDYIESLLSDLRETQNLFRAVEPINSYSIHCVVRLIDAFGNPDIQLTDSIHYWLRNARMVDNPVPILNTADILFSTGDLRLIKNSELRTEITKWKTFVKDYWLVPLYDIEHEHRGLYRDLTSNVDQFELLILEDSPADSLFPILPRSSSPFPLDARAFFNSQANYASLSDLYRLKLIMANYRLAMQKEAQKIETIIRSISENG